MGGGGQINNLSFNYKVSNIEKDYLRHCDCTVLSAVLEHVDKPNIICLLYTSDAADE